MVAAPCHAPLPPRDPSGVLAYNNIGKKGRRVSGERGSRWDTEESDREDVRRESREETNTERVRRRHARRESCEGGVMRGRRREE